MPLLLSPQTTQAISCPCSSFTTGPSPIGGVGVDVDEPGGGECELLETAQGSLHGESRVMSWCIHATCTFLPSPGARARKNQGLMYSQPADLGSSSCPHPPSVIMNYDLILARPHQHTGHCTPRHLDRQCHRTGPRWLLSASPAGNQFLLSAGPPPYWLTCALSATLHQG